MIFLIPNLGISLTLNELNNIDGIYYLKSSSNPFTGEVSGKSRGKIKNTTGLPNYIMFEWLQELEPAFVPKLDRWPLFKWSCKDKKEGERRGEIDLRNQLVHNLRGMKKSDVVEYLMGYQKVETDNVIKVYNEKVKQPFFEVIRLFKLDYTRAKLDKELKILAESLS